MFIDQAKIFVASGAGGNGAVMWRREKYVPAGGPAGGDGGRGGSVYIQATNDLNTLLDFRYNRKFVAEPGERGRSKDQHGKGAQDVVIRVPVGTVVYREDTDQLIADLHADGERVRVARGGRGGRGNARFATPTRKAPNFAEPGEPGEEFNLRLELKLLADVGLVGLPNAGKSTLISTISAARPKIADYPFTTLEPNLGVVRFGAGDTLVVADIPGLVEGAAEGVGLGHAFLRHVERCRLLLHLVDASGGFEGRDPLADFETLNAELARYSPELAARPMTVVLTKHDLPEAAENTARLQGELSGRGYPVFTISSATREGIDPLLNHLRQRMQELPPVQIYVPEVVAEKREAPEPPRVSRADGVWLVQHQALERQAEHLNFESADAVTRFHKLLDALGVLDMLRAQGVNDGDTVAVGPVEFEFVD